MSKKEYKIIKYKDTYLIQVGIPPLTTFLCPDDKKEYSNIDSCNGMSSLRYILPLYDKLLSGHFEVKVITEEEINKCRETQRIS